ncbi:hypothetical protein CHS0354_002400 [Potamilus streckersoni]|uniref:MAM domain-containing protein n=1 Tax=Potamilus streckersoni TaxID=2493646 RepID=A0AAE0VJ41_9BIVA|nr:hypothetical protein CHS0354_002400 [Potamilus streckersoni]
MKPGSRLRALAMVAVWLFVPPYALSQSGLYFDCDFENGLCGWIQATNDNLDWKIGSGPTETFFTGPIGDHTFGNNLGHYLYLESTGFKVGNNARLQSPVILRGMDWCFQFWYHMLGVTAGTLNVYIKVGSASLRLLWNISGNQGDQWQMGKIYISVQNDYFLVMEAVRGSDQFGDIAIDDIRIIKGRCLDSEEYMNCDFESGLCGWRQARDDQFDFVWHMGKTPSPVTGPDTDHTLGTDKGHYLYLNLGGRNFTDAARLESSLITSSTPKCLYFWFHMYGVHVYELNVYLKIEGSLGKPVWTQTGQLGNMWVLGLVSLHKSVPYRVVIEARRGPYLKADIAIDDLAITEGNCFDCNFESNLCSWSTNKTGFVWIRARWNDTKGSNYSLILLPQRNQLVQDTIELPPIFSDDIHCLKFRFMMTQNSGILRVFVKSPGDSREIWKFKPDREMTWQTVSLDISRKVKYQIVFDGSLGIYDKGIIAIDDVTVTLGSCLNCDFDNPTCFCSSYTENRLAWSCVRISTSLIPNVQDSLLRSGSGYIRRVPLSFTTRENSNLIGPVTSVSGPACLRFRYSSPLPSSISVLRVYLQPLDRMAPLLLGKYNGTENTWKSEQMEIQTSEVFQSLLEADNTVSIDDVSFIIGTCIDCAFETDTCGWIQNGSGSPFWQLMNTSIFDPTTPEKAMGIHFSISFKARTSGMRSVRLPPGPQRCLTFRFIMSGGTGLTLSVNIIQSGRPDFSVWSYRNNHQKNSWEQVYVDVINHGEAYLIFEGSAAGGVSGWVSVDDIMLTIGSCLVCSFERDLCNWQQAGADDSDWLRFRGETSTPDTGPTVDHTYGNDLGYYVFMESSAPIKEKDKARLLYPEMLSAGPKCMTLWYNMRGETIGALRVLELHSNGSESPIWTKIGEQGPIWLPLTIGIGTKDEPYMLAIEAESGPGYASDIAIDDIDLREGSCQDCDFENGFCTWDRPTTNLFYWKIWDYSSPSGVLDHDHTYNDWRGHFAYVNMSENGNRRANLVSSVIEHFGTICLQFWYSMNVHESQNSSLNVYLSENKKDSLLIWKSSGNEANEWYEALVDLSATTSYNVIFEVQIGQYCTGIIAVDDIRILPRKCTNVNGTVGEAKEDTAGKAGLYAGIAIIIVGIIVIIVVLILFLVLRKRRKNGHETERSQNKLFNLKRPSLTKEKSESNQTIVPESVSRASRELIFGERLPPSFFYDHIEEFVKSDDFTYHNGQELDKGDNSSNITHLAKSELDEKQEGSISTFKPDEKDTEVVANDKTENVDRNDASNVDTKQDNVLLSDPPENKTQTKTKSNEDELIQTADINPVYAKVNKSKKAKQPNKSKNSKHSDKSKSSQHSGEKTGSNLSREVRL